MFCVIILFSIIKKSKYIFRQQNVSYVLIYFEKNQINVLLLILILT